MNWIQWIGDWLGIPCGVTVAGNPNAWHMRRILRQHGVRVFRIRMEREQGAAWWDMWRKQADVEVGRYEEIVAADILREYGFDVRHPDEGAQHVNVPRRYAMRLHAIAMQRQRLQQPPTVQPQPRRAPWQQPAWMRR